MDKRISDRTRNLSAYIGNGRANVLNVSHRALLVEIHNQRYTLPLEQGEYAAYWIGQHIDCNTIANNHWSPAVSEHAAQLKILLGHLPKGAILEGQVVKRLRKAVLIDFGIGYPYRATADHFLRHARRQFRDGFLPKAGEMVTMTYYGLHSGSGIPILYSWDYARDPKYELYESGFRSHYRGEEGVFTELPWDRPGW